MFSKGKPLSDKATLDFLAAQRALDALPVPRRDIRRVLVIIRGAYHMGASVADLAATYNLTPQQVVDIIDAEDT